MTSLFIDDGSLCCGRERRTNGLRLANALVMNNPAAEAKAFLTARAAPCAKVGLKARDGSCKFERMPKTVRNRRQGRLPIITGLAGMSWGMALIRLLALTVLVLGISALAKVHLSGRH